MSSASDSLVAKQPVMTEYSAGSVLKIKLSPWTDRSANPDRRSPATAALAATPKYFLQVEVLRAFEPFTMAVTLHVKVLECLDEHGGPVEHVVALGHYILKLYDRRHANTMRHHHSSQQYPFDPLREAEYQAFLAARRAAQDQGEPEPEPTDEVRYEIQVEEMTDQALSCEASAYARMMRGRAAGLEPAAPLYYGEIEYETVIGTLQGVLIENISNSITLTAYLRRAATCGYLMADVPSVCDQVLKTAESIMTFEFIHNDARPDNVLLQCDSGVEQLFIPSTEKKFRVVFIDYGILRDRYEDETDLEWANEVDFTGADDEIGRNMEHCLADLVEQTCPIHDELCRLSQELPKPPLWKFVRAETFKIKLSEEHEFINNALYAEWGMYVHRPYPMTLEELQVRLAEDAAKKVGEEAEEAEEAAAAAAAATAAAAEDGEA